jgi:zinc/manganese transport system substrate-binding protein
MNINPKNLQDGTADRSSPRSGNAGISSPGFSAALFSIVLLVFGAATSSEAKTLKVVASLPDLASIAASVGGDAVEVLSIAKAGFNPHFVEVIPSHMIRVARADLYLKAGLGLDQWADAILEGSRNNRVVVVDASAGVPVLEKPDGKVDASMGDVHPQGNPHYWLNPSNGIRVAETIRDALKKADPARAAAYDANLETFRATAQKRIKAWKESMAPLRGRAIVTYHSSWPYFADAFATARHLNDLTEIIRAEKAGILIQEPYYPGKEPDFLARKTGIRVFRFTPSCEGTAAGDYWKHFDAMVGALTAQNIPGGTP